MNVLPKDECMSFYTIFLEKKNVTLIRKDELRIRRFYVSSKTFKSKHFPDRDGCHFHVLHFILHPLHSTVHIHIQCSMIQITLKLKENSHIPASQQHKSATNTSFEILFKLQSIFMFDVHFLMDENTAEKIKP